MRPRAPPRRIHDQETGDLVSAGQFAHQGGVARAEALPLPDPPVVVPEDDDAHHERLDDRWMSAVLEEPLPQLDLKEQAELRAQGSAAHVLRDERPDGVRTEHAVIGEPRRQQYVLDEGPRGTSQPLVPAVPVTVEAMLDGVEHASPQRPACAAAFPFGRRLQAPTREPCPRPAARGAPAR